MSASKQTVENSWRWEYLATWPASWEICRQVKKQQLELDMEQQTGSKSGKEDIKAVYCHPVFNIYAEDVMWNARLDEAQAGFKISGRNINNLRYAESIEELKSLLMKVKEESEKAGLKQQSKNEDHGIWFHHFMANR